MLLFCTGDYYQLKPKVWKKRGRGKEGTKLSLSYLSTLLKYGVSIKRKEVNDLFLSDEADSRF